MAVDALRDMSLAAGAWMRAHQRGAAAMSALPGGAWYCTCHCARLHRILTHAARANDIHSSGCSAGTRAAAAV